MDIYAKKDQMIAFENGELSDDEFIELFQFLIDTGHAWRLQGFYGRTAAFLIENGFCKPKIDLTSDVV